MPERIQLSRRKGWRMPSNTVSVARPGRWGNPFSVGKVVCAGNGRGFRADTIKTRGMAVEHFREMLAIETRAYPRADEIVAGLRGKNLACWCPLDQPCHADVLLEMANGR
jgi:hypothetical protein